MKIYGLSGKSGTGKSYNAGELCYRMNIPAIIDDGLFIYGTSIAAGVSAKKQETRIGAVKTALFMDNDHCAQVRAAIRRAKPSGASKLHWYDLDPKRQAASLEVVSSVPQQTTIVAALPLEGTKPERARRKALEEIVRRLIDMGVRKLVLESRNDTHDKRDRELLVSMRRRGEALDFDLEHVPGKDEPLLWVPDQILGAYGEVITKGASRKWEDSWRRVERTLDVREVPTR